MYFLILSHASASHSIQHLSLSLSPSLSRCTGYRPILDAFKTFTKSDPKAYTEEAIAASKGLPYGSTATVSGAIQASGTGAGSVCPSTGMPCDCKKAATPTGGGGGCGAAAAGGGGCGGCAGGGCAAGSGGCAPKALPGAVLRPSLDPIFPTELKKRPAGFLHMPGG